MEEPSTDLMQAMERIYRYRMTTASGGNLSMRRSDGSIWITPAAVDKGTLTAADMVHVHADGSCRGVHAPSSELAFHQAVYARRPDLNGLVHAHPAGLAAFSACTTVPDTRVLRHAHRTCGEVALVPYEHPGSERLGQRTADAMAPGTDCAILENHGVVVGGCSLQDAFRRFETLEYTARTVIRAKMIGTVTRLTDEQLAQSEPPADPPAAFRPTKATGTEQERRDQLSRFVKRAYRQRLVTGTGSTFSARVDATSFLITPDDADRSSLQPRDLVLIRGGRCEEGKTPGVATRSHEMIYRNRPDVGAVIHAHPVHASAFSLARQPLDTHSLSESYVFLRDVGLLPYADPSRAGPVLLQGLSPDTPAAILDHDGVIVTAPSVPAAFDRLEVVETTADALIHSRALGGATPMPQAALDELRKVISGTGH